jgi:hypothetical protein
MGKQVLAPGVIVAQDLVFWTTAMRFAGALVARQQFLPGIAEEPAGYGARWQPIFAGADAERLAKLAKAMPHVGRALTRDAAAAPQIPAGSVLTAFIGMLVDHLVRSTDTVPPVPHGRTSRVPGQPPPLTAGTSSGCTPCGRLTGRCKPMRPRWASLPPRVQSWQRPITAAAATPFRLCFRLEEPQNGNDTDAAWYVRYLLQAADDPSLLIPTPDAWRARGQRAAMP